jgi:hypothetical protein
LTDQSLTNHGDDVLTLQALIRARMDDTGRTYADLSYQSGGSLTKGRWQQLGTGRIRAFPEPPTLIAIAEVLEVDVTAVVLAAAQSLGIDARRRGPDLAQLLPAGTDRLSERMRDAILAIIRAAVAETLTESDDPVDGSSAGGSMDWPKNDAPGSSKRLRNVVGRTGDNRA